jgi:hypothetical protein
VISDEFLIRNAREDFAALKRVVDEEDLRRSTVRLIVAPILRRWIVYDDLLSVFKLLGRPLTVECDCGGFELPEGMPIGLHVSVGVTFGKVTWGSFAFVEVGAKTKDPPWITKQQVGLGKYRNQKVLLFRDDVSGRQFSLTREAIVNLTANKLGAAHSELATTSSPATLDKLGLLDSITFAIWKDGASAVRLKVANESGWGMIEQMMTSSPSDPVGEPTLELEGAFLLLYAIASDIVKTSAIISELS